MLWGKFNFIFLAFFCLAASASTAEQSPPRPIQSDSIEALFQVSKHVYSGGEPKGKNAFSDLRELGVKTIISVDGAKPDLESARAVGIHYIHIPTSYDRWSRTNQIRLIAAAKFALKSGPVFVHCHHGKHRGPTAVAVMCMGLQNWDFNRSEQWLTNAGTGTNYTGLIKTVREFSKPSQTELDANGEKFPESVEPSDMVEFMTQLDVTLDNIKQLINATDLDQAHLKSESLLLLESLRELERLPTLKNETPEFVELLIRSRKAADKFHDTSTRTSSELNDDFLRLKRSCSSCHRKFRD